MQFSHSAPARNLHGSAATQLRRGGNFYSQCMRRSLLIVTLKKMFDRFTESKNNPKIKVARVFLLHGVMGCM